MTDVHQAARNAAAADPAYAHTNYGSEYLLASRPAPVPPPARKLEFTVTDAARALGYVDLPAPSNWHQLIDVAAWKQDGLCRGVDPNLFHPERGDSTAAIIEMCSDCPVRAECLAYAISNQETVGLWGGTSGKQRRRMRSAMLANRRVVPMVRARQPINHGTPSGAQTHRRRGEKPCPECRDAWNTDQARYKRRWRA